MPRTEEAILVSTVDSTYMELFELIINYKTGHANKNKEPTNYDRDRKNVHTTILIRMSCVIPMHGRQKGNSCLKRCLVYAKAKLQKNLKKKKVSCLSL